VVPFTPTVSVVVAVYNGAEIIGDCLKSLLQQNYPAHLYEIIVVENGSTDNTAEIISNYPVKSVCCRQRGVAIARNFGVAQSQAEIIAFTDADCLADPQWLAELVKPYAAAPEIGGVGGAILAYKHPGRSLIEMFSDDHSPLVNFCVDADHEFLPRLYTANASYRRGLFNQIDGFHPHLITGQDVDFSWRLQLQTGCKLQYAPKAIIYHHHRATKTGLARQYRRYGFGEILLDTIYAHQPGYPRGRKVQLLRIMCQVLALFRYILSMIIRQIRLARGRITLYEAKFPAMMFLIESYNILGKLEGLIATRFMTDTKAVLNINNVHLIDRLFSKHKE